MDVLTKKIHRQNVWTNWCYDRDISFFKHYHKVEHKDGSPSKKITSLKKNIYSLRSSIKIAKDSNRRYPEFISSIEERKVGTKIGKEVALTTLKFQEFVLFPALNH